MGRAWVVGLLGASALVVLPTAGAKDFHAGDLRVCNTQRCVAIRDRGVLPALGSFYYGGRSPARAARPRVGAPYYELRFRNDYVTGIVATARLDRFLSYGVNTDRFARGRWYSLSPGISRELRRLTLGLQPLRVNRAAFAKSR